MNLNVRKLLRHIEYEPNTYYTAFSVELEAASSPLWSFINACIALVCLLHLHVHYFVENFQSALIGKHPKNIEMSLARYYIRQKRERLNKLPGIFNVQ